jgi:hypothetical protein
MIEDGLIIDHLMEIISRQRDLPGATFPFSYRTSSTIQNVFNYDVLQPRGVLVSSNCGIHDLDLCWEITADGYQLIRGHLSEELQKAGDLFYGVDSL